MKRKLIQLLMVFVLLGQIIAPSIQCIVQASEQLPVYVVKASQKKEIDKAKLSKVLKNSTISDATYTVSEPVALFTMVAGKLVEDAYLPIIVQKKIVALIRYNSETDKYVLEKETVVKEITSKYLETTNQSPLVLVCVSGEILGKNRTGYYNFSYPEMVEEEVKLLFSQVDLSAVNLENTQNIYDVPKADVTDDASHEMPETKGSESTDKAASTDKVGNTDKSVSTDKVGKPNKVDKTDDGLKDTGLKAVPLEEKAQKEQKIAPIVPRTFNTGYGPENKNYTNGLFRYNDYYVSNDYGLLTRRNLHFLVKSKAGKYAYTDLLETRSSVNDLVKNTGIDRFYYRLLGGDQGSSPTVGMGKNKLIQFEFKPEFYTYYASYTATEKDPYQGQSLNDLLNWLNFWTDNEISIVQMSPSEIEHDVLAKNTGVQFKPASKNYTKGLFRYTDYYVSNDYGLLSRRNLYFLIKSKDGKYAYTNLLETRSSVNNLVKNTGIDRVYYRLSGGDQGSAPTIGVGKNKSIQFEFKPEFYTYYASYTEIGKDPYQGSSLNDLLNWLNFWSDNEISIVQMSSSEIEHDVLAKNTGVQFKPASKYYTKGLIKYSDYYVSNDYGLLSRRNLYFLIKSKAGKYAYTNLLETRSSVNNLVKNTGIDRVYYRLSGGDQGSAPTVGIGKNKLIQFEFKPEFYTYYASYTETGKDPYQGQSLNDLLNWLNFWTDNEISIVQEPEIDLYTAQKNKEIEPWQFFKEGRTSSKNQYYSLSLDQTTRLAISVTGNAYKKLQVYNKEKQKYFDMSLYGASDVLDLPAGEYYISLTGITAKTTFQMAKSLFSASQLSVETTPEKTDIYLNHQFNPQLTAIYRPYHQKSGNNTAIDVINKLTGVWNSSVVRYDELDTLFGTNHQVKLPPLRQMSGKNLGYQPLGSDIRNDGMQYLGGNTFYSSNTLFKLSKNPIQRILVIDDLFYIGVAAVALYSAYLVSQTPTSSTITLTMPSLQFPSFGEWSSEDVFQYEDMLTYNGKTYGINENTGEIKDIASGQDFPEEIISKAFRAEIPKISTQAIKQALIGAEVKIPSNYQWYTIKDLIEDEAQDFQSSGGHTIAKHISKSDHYLKNRAKTGTMAIASSYDTVLQALIAINLAKIRNLPQFTTVSAKQVFSVDTGGILLGKGFDKEEKYYRDLINAKVIVMPSSSPKGYRVHTSYPVK